MAKFLESLCNLLGVPDIFTQYVMDPLKDQIRCLFCSERILDSLKDKFEKLKVTENNLDSDVEAAGQRLETVRPEVQDWLIRTVEIKQQTQNFLQNIPAEVQEGGINGICSNLKLHYTVSRDAMKMAKAIDALGDGKFERVADPAPPPGREMIPVSPGTEFESRNTKEEEIMAALRNESDYLIGICGMGGVGKTTMANKIWERAKEENLFDVVVMPVVSQQADRKRIQQEIAEALDLKLEQETESIRAHKLRTRLMALKKILIIIDDIWERMNLEELGIPSQSNHKGCKIILTSRDHHVCKQMKATKVFPLEVLPEEEAWDLFKDNAGTCVDECDLHPIAKDVARECKGLPLALVTVGRALSDRNSKPIWDDALEQLRGPAPSNITGDFEDVYRPLKWSYNHLNGEDVKHLFLLCCLFPEDSAISLKDLLYYGVGLGIFPHFRTLKAARDRVHGCVDILESRYMLMDAGTDEGIKCVKMHDLMRDVATSIASEGEHVFMSSHYCERPRGDSSKNYTCISLTLIGDVTLPECTNCSLLKLLRMKSFWDPQAVPETFFGRMKNLNVLDIDHITSLPSSLQFLEYLRILRLHYSKMKTVSIIGQLVNLEILDLRRSELEVLPEEIGRLENLKSLDLNYCHDLREIAPGVISSLKQLEELFMLYSFENWEAEVEGKERKNASLVEVASLKNLTALQLVIPGPEVLPQDAPHWPKLERFEIVKWPIILYSEEDYEDNHLSLDLNEITPLARALTRKAHCLDFELRGMGASDEVITLIQERHQDLKSLRLAGCRNMKYWTDILFMENIIFPKLRSLSFKYCRDLEGICSSEPPLAGSFDALKELTLEDLCKLTHLWDQKLCLPNLNKVHISNCSSLQYVFMHSTVESLPRLQTLDIMSCRSLQYVFMHFTVESLPRLQTLDIRWCPVLEEIFKAEIGGSADVVGPIVFPNLTKLYLWELPNLNSFCKAVDGLESSHSPESQFLFHQKVTLANLVQLRLCNLSNATKIFSSQVPTGSFNRLEILEVESCPNLEVIFSSPTFINFKKLGTLIVTECPKLENMVGKDDKESQAAVKETLFPELKELNLSKLPIFKKFCHMTNDIELPQLESITIVDCHQMETFSLGSLILPSLTRVCGLWVPDLAAQILFKKEVTFAGLVELKLFNLSTATKIFSSQVPIGSFSRLELLEVKSCPNLEVIFSPPTFRNFKKLGKLAVKNCPKLENVVGKDDEESQVAFKETLFPELKGLKLSGLPNFNKFCHMMNDIELPQLESITIVHCNQMETFSLGSLSLPRLTCVTGQWAPHLATQILFKKEVTFAGLVELKLFNLSSATKIFSSQVPIGSFSRLELLEVKSCPNLEVIFFAPTFRNFKKLGKLTVENCPKLENVVGEDDEESQAAVKETLFPELKGLELSELPKFKKFCHMTNDIELPQLESITIVHCYQMETFSSGYLSLPRLTCVTRPWAPHLATQILFKKEVTFAGLVELKLFNLSTATKIFSSQVPIGSFSRLELLEVKCCPNLEVIFSAPAFRNFKKLGKLTVESCPKLENVVKEDDEESQAAVKEILFPELKGLELYELLKFKKFCHMTNDIELPLLESITIMHCYQMETFSSGSLSLPRLTCVTRPLAPHLATQILFKKEVTFAGLVELKLFNLSSATKIFSSQVPIGSFSRLELLEVESCPNLEVIFSAPAFRNFKKLGNLTVKNCPKLENMVGEDDEESQAAVQETLFPELKGLVLLELPNFKKFCQMTNDIELPQLESITIVHCNQMETFSLGSLSLAHLTRVSGPWAPHLATQILFKKEVTFAGLVELKLFNLSTATKIFSSQVPIGSFSRLELLEVKCCPNLEVIFSAPAFRNFKKLGKLTVESCPKLENVVGDDDEESQAAVKETLFPELQGLKLSELANFKKFCHMMNDIELPQLESITIVHCNEMETFSSGSLSLPRLTCVTGQWAPHLATQILFKKEVTFVGLVELKMCNLSTATKIFSSQVPIGSFTRLELLEVEFCPNLEVIFSAPAFRNFKKLGNLTVKNCPKLENVVGEDDEESQAAVKETLFPKLKGLELSELPNFKKFCHMTNDIELPQLESITIVHCNQMETFSLGSLSLPRLTCVSGPWAPHLATQIIFKKEVTFAGLVELKLCNFSTATKIFSSQIPIGSFSRLELLEVESCPNLEVIFSPPVFRNFQKLGNLTVKNCPKLENVVGEDDEESQAVVKETLFPELKGLELSELPNFTKFCHMANDIELPQLESITIVDCNQMETFSLGSLSLPSLIYVFGLLEPDLATRILFKKETPRHEIHFKNNSCTLSARDLSISDDYSKIWKLCLAKDSSDNFAVIVVGKLEAEEHMGISGRFEIVKLSPETLYEVVFEIMLPEEFFCCRGPVKLQLTQSKVITQQERYEYLEFKPRGKWIEILVGEFNTGPSPIGDLEFSVSCDSYFEWLLVKGVTIRPKA